MPAYHEFTDCTKCASVLQYEESMNTNVHEPLGMREHRPPGMGTEGGREGGRERWTEEGREGGRDRRREERSEGGSEGGKREGEREDRRKEGGNEGGQSVNKWCIVVIKRCTYSIRMLKVSYSV